MKKYIFNFSSYPQTTIILTEGTRYNFTSYRQTNSIFLIRIQSLGLIILDKSVPTYIYFRTIRNLFQDYYSEYNLEKLYANQKQKKYKNKLISKKSSN